MAAAYRRQQQRSIVVVRQQQRHYGGGIGSSPRKEKQWQRQMESRRGRGRQQGNRWRVNWKLSKTRKKLTVAAIKDWGFNDCAAYSRQA